MKFADLQRDVIFRTLVCAGTADNPIVGHEPDANRLLAAATLVINDKGLKACQQADLQDFFDWTINRLGFWVSLGLFLFGGVGFLWLIAKLILPALVDWLNEQDKIFGSNGVEIELPSLAAEAEAYLNSQI